MIKLVRKENITEKWKKWVAKCEQQTFVLIEQFNSGAPLQLRQTLYKNQKAAIAALSHGKCVFCEKKILSTQYGEVEHYRPKAGVSEANWSLVQYTREGRTGKHRGYFWLAYDFKNLMLACIACNQTGADREWGKSTRFPVKGFRAEKPNEERDESPMLINPFEDDPIDHIAIDETGILAALNGSEKGAVTIDVLGLNKRGLEVERAQTYAQVRDKMSLLFAQTTSLGAAKVVEQIRDLQAPHHELAYARRAAVKGMLDTISGISSAISEER